MTVTRTPRLGLVTWSSDSDPWSREDIVEGLDQLEHLAATFEADDAGSRPVAGVRTDDDGNTFPTALRFYLALDTGRLSLDTGAAWRDVATLDTANTYTQPQTFTGAINANGGLTAGDGQLELNADVAVSGKFGANGATPVARAAATAELKAALVATGLLTDGGATPLDLDGGALTAGAATFTGVLTPTGGIAFTPTGAIAATTVAGALAELDADLTTHIGATGAHIAAKITNTPAGGIAATTVQAAIDELDTEKATVVALSAHTGAAAGAHAATAISNTPAGGIAATTVQAALNELDTEKADKASPTFTGTTTVAGLTATGNVSLGDASSDLIGFYGATAIARPGTYNLTGTADRTLGAYASDPESSAYTGTPADAASTAKLADLNALRVAYENLRVYVEDLAGLAVATATDLKALGLVG